MDNRIRIHPAAGQVRLDPKTRLQAQQLSQSEFIKLNGQVAQLLQTEVWSYIKELTDVFLNLYQGVQLPVTEEDERRYRNAAISRQLMKAVFLQIESLAQQKDKLPAEIAQTVMKAYERGETPEIVRTTTTETI